MQGCSLRGTCNLRAAMVLLEKGASIAAEGKGKNTALHFAARSGHTSLVELLFKKGASLEVKDIEGDTPLHHAAGNGHTSTVELLLRKGPLIVAETSPLIAKDSRKWITFSQLASPMARSALINSKNRWGRTPLDYAEHKDHYATELLLRKEGAAHGEPIQRMW